MTSSSTSPPSPRAERPASGRGPLLLVLQDLVYLGGCAASYGCALAGTRAVLSPAAARWGGWVWAMPGLPLFLFFSLLFPILVHRVLPPLRPGIYRLDDRRTLLWILRFAFQRVLNLWPIRQLLFYSHVLRWILLNSLGSRVGFTSLIASDVTIIDWQMLRIGARCTVGTQAHFYTHTITGDRLVLGETRLDDDVELGAETIVAFDTSIGKGSRISFRAAIGPFCNIGAGVVIHEMAVLRERVVVEDGAVVEAFAFVPAGTKIGARERWGGSPAVRLGEVRQRAARPG
jgi:carbonic anhydrase/acetyltransferase-like protein (isoleucine patch superfamily)